MKQGKIIFTVIVMFYSVLSFGQLQEDVLFVRNVKRHAPPGDQYETQIAVNNELQLLLGSFFLGYKRFVSSQDSQSCGFHPSCSVFAVDAMRQKGLISGYFLAFDRISRCHEFSRGHYPTHPETGLKLDYVVD